MNQSFQEFLPSSMQLSMGKMIKINKLENRFSKPKPEFGFKTPSCDGPHTPCMLDRQLA